MQMTVDRVIGLAQWLLLAGIAYTTTASVGYFVSPLDSTSNNSMTGTISAAADDSRRATLELAQSTHLFGVAQEDEVVPSEPIEVATGLPLELRGVFVSDSPVASVAILARRNHRAERYRVGEMVPGEVELIAILSDHVILNNGGRREILSFPKRTEGSRRAAGVLSD
jgi:type II secretory pathway component PulC